MTPLYENGKYWVAAIPKGYAVYKTGITASERCATITGLPNSLERAKSECDLRASRIDTRPLG